MSDEFQKVSNPVNSYGGTGYYPAPYAPNDGFNFRELARKLRKRKKMIMIIAVMSVSIVTIEAYRTKTVYQAEARVLVGHTHSVNKSGASVNQSENDDGINTVVQLLQTEPLLEDVIVGLGLDKNPKFIEASTRRTTIEALRLISDQFKSKKAIRKVIAERSLDNEPADFLDNKIKKGGDTFNISLSEVERSEEEKLRLEPYVKALKNNLTVTQWPKTRIILIQFQHSDKNIASTVANVVAKLFVAQDEKSHQPLEYAYINPIDQKYLELKQQLERFEAMVSSETKPDKVNVETSSVTKQGGGDSSSNFEVLKTRLDAMQNIYNEYVQKTDRAGLNKGKGGSDLRIIQPARQGIAIGPNRLTLIGLCLLSSLLVGTGIALLTEYVDNTVKSIDDVARFCHLPTLAMIPSMSMQSIKRARKKLNNLSKSNAAQKRGILYRTARLAGLTGRSAPQPRRGGGNKLATLDGLSSVVEAYRMLRTSVLLSTAGTPPKTIMITSSRPGEGKTTTAINTAISMSQLGVSVLLLDADMRRPAVHKTFKLNHNRGLSSYLSGATSSIGDLISEVPIPNLDILTAGPIPPNPAELVASDRMKQLLKELGKKYNHIVIDSPPLGNVTDPIIVSTVVDGVVLVVQAGKTTREMMRRSGFELNGVGAKIFGVVLNNVDLKREGFDEYYYYRYYTNYFEQKI